MLLDLVREPAVGTNFLTDVALDVIHDEVDNLVESPYLPEVRAILLLPHLEPPLLLIPWAVLLFLLRSPPVLGCPLDRLVEEVLFPRGKLLGLRVLLRRGVVLFKEKLVLLQLVLQLVNEGVLLVKQIGMVGADLFLHAVQTLEALALFAEGAANSDCLLIAGLGLSELLFLLNHCLLEQAVFLLELLHRRPQNGCLESQGGLILQQLLHKTALLAGRHLLQTLLEEGRPLPHFSYHLLALVSLGCQIRVLLLLGKNAAFQLLVGGLERGIDLLKRAELLGNVLNLLQLGAELILKLFFVECYFKQDLVVLFSLHPQLGFHLSPFCLQTPYIFLSLGLAQMHLFQFILVLFQLHPLFLLFSDQFARPLLELSQSRPQVAEGPALLFKKGFEGRKVERGRLKRKGRKVEAGELTLNEMNCSYN